MDPKNLLLLVEATLRETGLTATQFGLGALNDPNLVGDLRGGRELRHKNMQRVLDFIAKQREAA